MTEEEKKEIAVFRFGVICEFVNGTNLEFGEKERLLQDKCNRKWTIPGSGKTSLSRSTILGWIRLYQQSNGKLESLYPCSRSDSGKFRSLDDETGLALMRLKKKKPDKTIEQVIDEMKKRNLVTPGTSLNYSNTHRFLHQNGLIKTRKHNEDRRKFEAENPNDLWQSDVMHGPKIEHEGKMRKSYLIAIIDDYSRLITGAGFYLSENLKTYLKVLENAFLTRGLCRKLYVDNGPAFKSNHLKYITASLGIALIHARAFMPQGKGKIERWFRTVRMNFLPGFSGKTLHDLNIDFEKWLNGTYHQKKHGSTGQTPFNRFTSNMECIRTAPQDLKNHFRKTARRKVAKDRTITLNGRIFEAPVNLIGSQVEVKYHEESPEEAEVVYKNKSYGMLSLVNLNVNCRVKRHRWNANEILITSGSSKYKGGKLL